MAMKFGKLGVVWHFAPDAHLVNGSSGVLDSPALMEALDDELEHSLMPSVAMIKRYRNGLNNWCSLPVETMCTIFKFALSLDGWPTTEDEEDEEGNKRLHWLAVTQVCHLWRIVALEYPCLWTEPGDLFMIPSPLIPRIIERSRTLPLRLSFQDGAISTRGTTERLAQCFSPSTLSRLRGLRLHRFSRTTFARAAEHLQLAIPSLRELHVTLLLDDVVPTNVPTLPLDLCVNPSLVELVLVDCLPSRWDAPFFRNLQRMDLYCSEENTLALLPTPQQLSDLLISATSLEVLTLENVFPKATTYIDYPHMILPPTLRSMTVTASEDTRLHRSCLVFVIRIYCEHHIHIGVRINDPFGNSEPDVFSDVYHPSIHTLACMALSNVYVLQGYPTNVILDGRRSLTSNCERSHSVEEALFQDAEDATTRVSFYMDAEVSEPDAQNSFFTLPLSKTGTIMFACRAAPLILAQPGWITAFSGAQEVRRLGIYIEDCAALLPLLVHHTCDIGTFFTIFPRLNFIFIYVDDPVTLETTGNRQKRLACAAGLEVLLAVVRTRQSLGHPVQEIMIDSALLGWPEWGDVLEDIGVTVSHCRFVSLSRMFRDSES
ncbi:unnamed protein product [Peniophora sp. CBMAI 1063]|nr:unnamed protein product [Peniophora sp. CBMAI 1063]